MSHVIRPGEVLAGRYRLVDLLDESGGGLFWRAFDSSLDRSVAVHIIPGDDERAGLIKEAARTSARVVDRRLLRVLDVDEADGLCFVVNEWATGTSLDILIADEGPLAPRRAAWLVSEVAATIEVGHAAGVAHGRLVPENVLIDRSGSVRVIGFAVDAALHGLPPGRVSADVVDLGGLVYFALTARWPGVSRSAVKPAPLDHGRVLRARQVRAGVPRVLDALCDAVLEPDGTGPGAHARGNVDLSTAGGISDALREFVGDPSGLADAERVAMRRREAGLPGALPAEAGALVLPGPDAQPTASEPAAPEPDALEPATSESAAPEPGPSEPASARLEAQDPTPTLADLPADLPPGDQPTEAGIPIFDDSGGVSWLSARADQPPPPPPFEPPVERPLFAPDPVDGRPARRARAVAGAGVPTGAGGAFWPWDTTTGHGSRVGTGSGTGSGTIEPVRDLPDEPSHPGRSWLWLAGVVAAALVTLLAVVFAFNLGTGRAPLGGLTDDPSSSSSSGGTTRGASEAAPYADLVATDFDPQGDPPEENRDLAPRAVDGDPATAWRTMTYTQQLGPTGLKTGVGLTVDLGKSGPVTRVDLTFVGTPTRFEVFVTDSAPTSLDGLTASASATASETEHQITLEPAVTGRFVTVWMTGLPQVEGGYRGEIAEIVVFGAGSS